MADMMATLSLGFDASPLEVGLPNIKRLLDSVATAAKTAETAQKNYNTAAKIAAPSSNASDITRQFRALQALNAAQADAKEKEQALAAAQVYRMRLAREMMPLFVANADLQRENIKAKYDEINATSAEIAILNNAKLARREDAAAAAAAAAATQAETAATQALAAAQTAATPATQAATTATQAATTAAQGAAAATQALNQQQAAVPPVANAAAAATKKAADANADAGKKAVTLTEILAKLGLAYTGGQVVRAAGEVLTLAARYQTLGVVLDVVGRNVGTSRREMRALSEGLQEQGISAIASREELARMAAANLDLSKAVKVAEVAQNAAVIAGTNSSAAFERVITAITTQQPRVLRTIGIYVNFEAAQEKYAKAHGRRMEQLTGQERAQINLDTALKGGAQVVGAYSTAMNTAGKQLTSTVRYMQDMKTQLGETFLPQFTAGVKIYGDALKLIGDNANTIAPIVGGVLVTAVLLAASAVAVLAAGVVALTLPFYAIAGAVAAGVAAMAYFGLTAGKMRKETAALNKSLDEDSDVVTAYTKKISTMSLALLEAEKRQSDLRAAADFSLLSGLGADVVSARKAVAAKPDYRATLAQRSETKSANTAALAAAEKAYADALRMSNIAEQERAKLLQETEKRTTETVDTTEDAAKKSRDYAKTLREANDALLISAAVMAAGAAPTLAQKRALEDLNTESELAAKILDIKASAMGKDADLTKAQAAQLILLTQHTAANTAETVKQTRAYEDQQIVLRDMQELREANDALMSAEMTRDAGPDATKAQLRAIEDVNAENALAAQILAIKTAAAQKDANISQEQTAEMIRLAVATAEAAGATRDATRAYEDSQAAKDIDDQLKAQRDEIAVLLASNDERKREVGYLTLRNAKIKEYIDLLKGQGKTVGDDDKKKAEEAATAFVALQRIQDALKRGTIDWAAELKDVNSTLRNIGDALGDEGKKAVQFITLLTNGIELLVKAQKRAQDAAASAKAKNDLYAMENPGAAPKTGSAFSQASGYQKAGVVVGAAIGGFSVGSAVGNMTTNRALGTVGGGLSGVATGAMAGAALGPMGMLVGGAIGGLAGSIGGFLSSSKKAKEALKAQKEAQDALNTSLVQLRASISGDALAGAIASVQEQFKQLRKQTEDTFKGRKLEGQRNVVLAELNALEATRIKQLKDEFAVQQAGIQTSAEVRRLNALGRTEEAAALAQKADNEKEIADLVKANATEQTIAAVVAAQLAEAEKRLTDARVKQQRTITDLYLGARAFVDPRGAEDAALAEEQSRRVFDAIVAGADEAELAAIAFFNAAQRANFEAQRLEGDRRTGEGLVVRTLRASGAPERAVENFATLSQQRQELADAIKDGMSPTNIELLKFAQFAEREQIKTQRAIEDGTKAINDKAAADVADIDELIEATKSFAAQQIARLDAQLDVAKDAAKTAQSALQTAEKNVQATRQVVESLSSYLDGLLVGGSSPLSPEAQLLEARRQFNALAQAALGGDATAAQGLGGAASTLLDSSKNYNASGAGFVQDFEAVRSTVAAVRNAFGTQLSADERALAVAQQQLASAEAMVASLEAQKEAAKVASDKEISKLEATRQSILDAAEKQILQLIADENAKLSTRIRENEFYATFEEYARDAQRFFNNSEDSLTPPTPEEQAQITGDAVASALESRILPKLDEQATSLRTAVSLLQLGFSRLIEAGVNEEALTKEQTQTIRRGLSAVEAALR